MAWHHTSKRASVRDIQGSLPERHSPSMVISRASSVISENRRAKDAENAKAMQAEMTKALTDAIDETKRLEPTWHAFFKLSKTHKLVNDYLAHLERQKERVSLAARVSKSPLTAFTSPEIRNDSLSSRYSIINSQCQNIQARTQMNLQSILSKYADGTVS